MTSTRQLLDIYVGGDNSFVQSPSYPEPTAPAVTTSAATGVEQTGATLNGYLDSLGTSGSVTVYFEWGTSTFYGIEIEVGTMTSSGGFSSDLLTLLQIRCTISGPKQSATAPTTVST